MAKFEIAYKKTAIDEQGYQCWEDDNGNWTGGKKGVGVLVGTIEGITAQEVMNFLGRVPTVADMKSFPESARKQIYKTKYWNGIRGDEILDQSIANKIYDEAVNAGESKAIKEAQEIAGLPITGKMTAETLAYINNPK